MGPDAALRQSIGRHRTQSYVRSRLVRWLHGPFAVQCVDLSRAASADVVGITG